VSAKASAAKRLLKRWSRRAVIRASGLIHRRRAGLSRGLRILTYHRVAEIPVDPFSVPPRDFATQMQILSDTRAVFSLEATLEALDGDGAVPRIVLTFDDGTKDFVTDVLPVLSRLGLPATLYVSPALVGREGYLDWNDLALVSRTPGITLGSHGFDHQSLGKLDPGEVWLQVSRSRQEIEDRLGRSVASMAYPYGTRRDFNESVKRLVQKAGYQAACTSLNGVNRSQANRYELRRTKIEQGDQEVFFEILLGRLDGWALIDRYLWSLQSRYA
jgi:peptidoglycan/xylan/chitin deacetylase (PgdA/CDA1 family)